MAYPNDMFPAHPDEIDILGELITSINDGDIFNGVEPEPGAPDVVESINGFFDDIASGFKAVVHAAADVGKAIVHSPITKVIAGATALVMPAVGVPLAAGLVVADRAIQVADGLRPTTPEKRARVQAAVRHTIQAAKLKTPQGLPAHPEAQKFVELMHLAQNLRKAQDKRLGRRHPPHIREVHGHGSHARVGTLVTRDPRTHKLVLVKHSKGFLTA